MLHVLIERRVMPELTPHYERIAREVLANARTHPGFVSGETLHELNRPEHHLILATFRHHEDWESWYQSRERHTFMSQLRPLLMGEEVIRLFTH